jgi:opacity protein-like surface antigen
MLQRGLCAHCEDSIMFKAGILAATLSFGLASQGSAQDASGWQGPYAGIAGAFGNGFQDFTGGLNYDLEGQMLGVVLGYNLAPNGPWVFGGEAAVSSGSIYEAQIGGSETYPEFEFTRMLDLKARAGYSFGTALVYGSLGYSLATYSNDGDKSNIGGLLYGLGADYLVSDRVFLGAEYVKRRADDASLGFDADLDTFSLRMGLKF